MIKGTRNGSVGTLVKRKTRFTQRDLDRTASPMNDRSRKTLAPQNPRLAPPLKPLPKKSQTQQKAMQSEHELTIG